MHFGHGGDGFQYNKQILADFSTNVWSGVNTDELKDIIFQVWHKVRQYPHPTAEGLQRIIARNYAVNSSMVLPTNGATEAIYLIAQAFRKSVSCIFYPSFSEYEDACRINQHDIHLVHWDEIEHFDNFPGGLVFICNPNNPDGRFIPKSRIKEILDYNQNTILVLDETFVDFCLDTAPSTNLLYDYKNLIIIRSLSHQNCIPGLRLGYIMSNEEIINKIKSIKAPWTINTLAIEAGKYFMTHLQKYALPVNQIFDYKKRLTESMEQIELIEVVPSHTTFFLIKIHKRTAADLKKYLANFFNVLIRDASNFRGLDESYARISTLDLNKNLLLIKALREWYTSIT